MTLIHLLEKEHWPKAYAQTPHPPEKLFVLGEPQFNRTKTHYYICIVGARRYSGYGKEACETIIRGLKGLPITVVSGLALGIDSIAHQSALANNLQTIAFPGSGLGDDVLYPATNIQLSRDIVSAGGSLISEYEKGFISTPWAFPRRNRLMAALCDITLVIEATKKSGSLITARLALDYNKIVAAVPGSIFSDKSAGPHYLLQQGAIPIYSAEDIVELLEIQQERSVDVQLSLFESLTKDQKTVADLLGSPLSKADLIHQLDWPAYKTQIILMELEILGLIKESYGQIRLT